jgi:hypothetical protein
MLTLKIRYPDLPEVIVEGDSHDMASLLLRLGGRITGGDVLLSSPLPHPSRGIAASRVTNRRDRVIVAMGTLKESGKTILRLDAIRHQVGELFPGEEDQHLDQVVRDLANKTDLVERCDRGTFRLTDTGLELFDKFDFKN